MEKTITYRLAKNTDIQSIKCIYDSNIDKLHGVFRSEYEWEEILESNPNHYVVIVEKTIVGWFRVDFENDKIFLGMLQVDPNYHKQGIGTNILNVFENIAAANNHEETFVHTTKDNEAAIRFYLKNNYRIISEEECQTADGVTRQGLTLRKKKE